MAQRGNSRDIYGVSGKRQSNAGGQYWASSNIDEEEKQPGLRDKKYEGYSNLKASHEQQQKKTLRQKENILAKGLEEEYILNMQKQVVLMEHEIKLLKDREVDQKNKASGYETLLRDGIPLNEHFLALKNKFNNEKDDLEKFVHGLEDEIKRDEMNNKNKRHKIEILKREYDEINQRYQIYKDHTQKQMKEFYSQNVSQNENQFYKSKKQKKPTTSYNKYSYSTPDEYQFKQDRKPDTPLQPLITVGNYQSKIEIPTFKRLSAMPGAASSIFERNKRAQDEIQIKPITQLKVQAEHYNPKNYLSPHAISQQDFKDISMNNLHSTRVYNRKMAAISQTRAPSVLGGELAREIPKNQFSEARKLGIWSGSMSTSNMLGSTKNSESGKINLLAENRNYISQNENQFYKSNKIFFKPTTSYNKYSYSTPDYFRVDQKDLNKTGQAFKPGETVTVVSRNNGWLTVDPTTMSRKNAFEKEVKGNLHKTSHMSPSWMQTEAKRDETQMKQFKPLTVKRQNIRCESNRLFLADKQEPAKSIFNLGQIRHNLMTKDEATKQLDQMKNYSTQPVRFLEWKETPSKQPFDFARITGKIGQNQ